MSDAALRALERAAESGGAAAWSALALARARAGDTWRAYADAVRALRLDPTAPVRELLVPVGGRPCPWPGLTRFASPRIVELSKRAFNVVDLGGGFVAVSTGARMVAVDLFTGAERWTNEGQLRPEVTTGSDLLALRNLGGLRGIDVVLIDAALGTTGRRLAHYAPERAILELELELLPVGTRSAAVLGTSFGDMSYVQAVPHRMDLIDLTCDAIVSTPLPALELGVHLRRAPDGLVVAAPDGLVGVDSRGTIRWTRKHEDERLEVLGDTEDALLVGSVRQPDDPELIWDHDDELLQRIERLDSRTGVVLETLDVALKGQTWCGLVQDALVAVEQIDPIEPAWVAHSGHVLRSVPLPRSAATPWRVEYRGCLVRAVVTADSIVAQVTSMGVGGRWLVALDPLTGQELDRLELHPGRERLTLVAGHAVLVPEDPAGPTQMIVIGGRDVVAG